MIVYHGGTDIIEYPIVGIGREGLDFGKGFYVTDIRKQAENWASRMADRRHKVPILNIYDFDLENAYMYFRHIEFKAYDKEWLNFIASNRRGMRLWEDYDIVAGGVADDRVVDTIEAYIAELMSEDIALKRLSMHAPNNQLCLLNQSVVDKYLFFCRID